MSDIHHWSVCDAGDEHHWSVCGNMGNGHHWSVCGNMGDRHHWSVCNLLVNLLAVSLECMKNVENHHKHGEE